MLHQQNTQVMLSTLTLTDIGNNKLIATGPQNAINLLRQHIQHIQKVQKRMAFETWECKDPFDCNAEETEEFKPWNIVIEQQNERCIQLTGEWELLNDTFATHGLTVQPARATTANLACTS